MLYLAANGLVCCRLQFLWKFSSSSSERWRRKNGGGGRELGRKRLWAKGDAAKFGVTNPTRPFLCTYNTLRCYKRVRCAHLCRLTLQSAIQKGVECTWCWQNKVFWFGWRTTAADFSWCRFQCVVDVPAHTNKRQQLISTCLCRIFRHILCLLQHGMLCFRSHNPPNEIIHHAQSFYSSCTPCLG